MGRARAGQVQLGRNGIDRIDHIIRLPFKQESAVIGQIKLLGGHEIAVRADGAQPQQSGLRLGHPNDRPRGDKLSVQVCFIHCVMVDQQKMPHAGAAERLGRGRPNAAKPQYGHARPLQPADAILADQQRRSFLPILHTVTTPKPGRAASRQKYVLLFLDDFFPYRIETPSSTGALYSHPPDRRF